MTSKHDRDLPKEETMVRKMENTGRREPRYHVYVRLPFNRGDFVDPPPVSRMAWFIMCIPDSG
jgi:hypothetical protein